MFTSDTEFYGNGTQAYIEAYNVNTSKPGSYNAAKANAYKLLTKQYICDRINKLLEDGGLNDQFVDKQLLKLITQDADFHAKKGAIAEYNKLKSRITEKVQHSGSITLNFDRQDDGL